MNPAALPRTRRQQIDWTTVLETLTPGQVLTLECPDKRLAYSIRTTASKRARDLGIPHITRTKDCTVRITILKQARGPKPMNGTLRQALSIAQAAHNNIPQRLMHAKRQADHWRTVIYQTETSAATEHAIAVRAAWKMTAAILLKQLRTPA